MKEFVRQILHSCKEKQIKSAYYQLYQKIIDVNPHLGKYAEGEEQWLEIWRQYDKTIKPTAYRIFSRYVGQNMDILPLEFSASKIEPCMTPGAFTDYYSDKNMLHRMFPSHYMPRYYLRNVRGYFMDAEYNMLSEQQVEKILSDIDDEKIVLKPSREGSGRGFCVLYKKEGHFRTKDGQRLTMDFLKRVYKKDYLLMAWAEQSDFAAQFNDTSVNTIRMATYRDMHESIQPLGAAMRFGAVGAVLDNAHCGGVFCGIMPNGTLQPYVCDWLGRKQETFNHHDFSRNAYTIPNWSEVQRFATNVSKHVLHHDLVALDIYIDKTNTPKLIEINVGSFASWFFQFAGFPTFGAYTKEIVERYTASQCRESFTMNI